MKLKRGEMNSKHQITTKQTRKWPFGILVATLVILSRPGKAAQAYSLTHSYTDLGSLKQEFDCHESSKKFFFSVRLKQPGGGKVIRFYVNKPTNPPSNRQYISNKFQLFDSSTLNCYVHVDPSGKNSNPLFIFVIENNGSAGPDYCQITGIITQHEIEACGGSTTKLIDSFVGRKTSTHAAATTSAFSYIQLNPVALYPAYKPQMLTTTDLTDLDNIDEHLIEALLTVPLYTQRDMKFTLQMSYDLVKNVNNHLSYNPFASQVYPGKITERLMSEKRPPWLLPGPFLGRRHRQEQILPENNLDVYRGE